MDEAWRTVTIPEETYVRLKAAAVSLAEAVARAERAEQKNHELANRIDALCHEHGAAMLGSTLNSLNCLVGVLVEGAESAKCEFERLEQEVVDASGLEQGGRMVGHMLALRWIRHRLSQIPEQPKSNEFQSQPQTESE